MLIEGATVITLDTEDRILSPGWIRVENGIIEQVSAVPIDRLPGEATVDGTNHVVIPGLINAHTHLFQVLIRGVIENRPFERWLRDIYHCGLALSDEDAHAAARLGGMEALLSGTTTVVEHHFLNARDGTPDATIDGLGDVGVRRVLARTSMDIGHLAPPEVLETPDQATTACDALIGRHRDALASRSLLILVGPNTPGVSASAEMAVAMTEFALDRDVGQSMHVAESQSSLRLLHERTGIRGVVRWLDGLGALRGPILSAHSVHVDAEELGIMADRGVTIVHNPVSNLFLGDGIAPIVAATEAGVRVALGTDGAASNNNQDMFEVMKLAALLQRGDRMDGTRMPPGMALRMATIEAARALGIGDVVGSIEPGKRADLVVLDLTRRPNTVALHDAVSQIVHCAPSASVTSVFVDGERVVDEGRLTRLDGADVMRVAQSLGRRLADRL